MKKILFFIFIPFLSFGQNYNGPESVEHDPNNNVYYISNSGNGQILELDNNDNLSVFVDGLQAGPHGLELVEQYIGEKWIGQILYACSGGTLYGYDLYGNEVLNYSLNGSFLNGITHKIDNSVSDSPEITLFITDFSDKKLYQYNVLENTHYEICSFSKNPNGAYYDHINNRLLVVFWGWNAPIYEVNIVEGTYNSIINTGLSNLDGITMDNCGNFYISAWSSNALHKYNSEFSQTEIITSGLSNPADIFYNATENTIAIPNSGNNTIEFVLGACNNSVVQENLTNKNLITTIDMLGRLNTNNKFQLELYDDGSINKKYILK